MFPSSQGTISSQRQKKDLISSSPLFLFQYAEAIGGGGSLSRLSTGIFDVQPPYSQPLPLRPPHWHKIQAQSFEVSHVVK